MTKLTKIRIILLLSILLFLFTLFGTALLTRVHLMEIYHTGISKIENEEYEDGISILEGLGNYQESDIYIKQAKYRLKYKNAISFLEVGNYNQALDLFKELAEENFEDSASYVTQIEDLIKKEEENLKMYTQGKEHLEAGDYQQALNIFTQIDDYKDSHNLAEDCRLILNRLIYSNTLSAGIRYSVGVQEDGSIAFSGRDFKDEDVIRSWQDIVSVSVENEFVVGLKKNGSVVVAKKKSKYDYRIDTSEWKDIIAVSVGEQFVVGLRSDGTLTAQGIDGYGETDIDNWTNIIAISTGWQHTVGLDAAGNIYITGYNSEEQLRQIAENREQWENIVAISAGGGSRRAGPVYERGHTVALRQDGTVLAVGDNGFGQCNVDNWTDIVAISAGDFHTVGLKSDGTVVTTLTNVESFNEISEWKDIVAVSAGYGFTLGLKSDGTVVGAGYDWDGQRETDGWENIAYRPEWNLIFDIGND